MENNFFKQLQTLGITSLSLSITFNDGTVSVSILPKSDSKDKAVSKIKALTLTDTPENLDKGFFDTIQSPMEETARIFNNIRNFEEQTKQAEQQSAYQKAQKEKVQKLLTKLKDIQKAEDFNPLESNKKVIALANDILELNPKNKEAEKAIEAMKEYEKPTLFKQL